jgi:hypothetical protein
MKAAEILNCDLVNILKTFGLENRRKSSILMATFGALGWEKSTKNDSKDQGNICGIKHMIILSKIV